MYSKIMNIPVVVRSVIHNRLISFFLSILTFMNMSAMDNDASSASTLSDTIGVAHRSDVSISRNLFIEIGGPSYGIGLGYDQRFRQNSVFGFRAGLSFTSGYDEDSGKWGSYAGGPYTWVDFKGVTLPLEVNAIMGKRASKFELGVGVTPCILHRHEEKHGGFDTEYSGNDIKDGIRLNIFGSINIGYRLQRKSGFFLRTGLTLLIGDLKTSPIYAFTLIPNLSLGYTIR